MEERVFNEVAKAVNVEEEAQKHVASITSEVADSIAGSNEVL